MAGVCGLVIALNKTLASTSVEAKEQLKGPVSCAGLPLISTMNSSSVIVTVALSSRPSSSWSCASNVPFGSVLSA